ncbi:hypothetical protein NG800_002080 [Epilithonimonas ginsengisoli]|uniref:T9SS C-terminal target domain-containing protein n=1 Tax=Epilithonimonas ginsengisoli TaxID=1245592 RepID=A0ABU4JDF2_9FLAO|nr:MULTISPECIES: hypothetical protein [Chryseobacterium group]MBV6878655.1 hypothetical protein [Epilithonimonas sp. FP105]MDW8547680.1 hypothetical protein [Epilithonimonas ginsengisoli]OAH75270.1 hypothetical protein AXA65_04690 [Chryseobacterium sp. FP211-J200]
MKTTINLILFLLASTLYGQVGVMTEKPQSSLDVNGDFNKKGKLFLDNNGVLSPGQTGQVLVSRGAGVAPTWKALKVPDYESFKFYLIFNDSFKDFNTASNTTGQGVSLSTATSPATIAADLVKGADITTLITTKGFKEITGLAKPFVVNSIESKVYFQFETVVQQNNTAILGSNQMYACGIFVDDKLQSIRLNTLFTSNTAESTFLTHNQIGGASNLSKGDHTVRVACARYTTDNNIVLGIGVPSMTAANNVNNFMTQASLKVDVYEVPENFTDIFSIL